jgi:ppGpp synthetase/RelA/SpoT-type nucleotidyltranferase
MTNAQIDRLGERLKRGRASEADLRLLDEFRLSFTQPYIAVVGRIRQEFGMAVTGRQAKTSASVFAKLQREHLRLSQMQDIAGCRMVVGNIVEQGQVATTLSAMLPSSALVDRRVKSSHGYRAVHVIVNSLGKPIEVQVRTVLLHSWAELSEKISDRFGSELKYGGGPEFYRQLLMKLSELVASLEALETRIHAARGKADIASADDALFNEIEEMQGAIERQRHTMLAALTHAIGLASTGTKNDISH